MVIFEKDIVDDVYRQYNGKYTREQISDIFESSISYSHFLIRYTDALSVRIPFIGNICVNLRDLKVRFNRLRKKKNISYSDESEMKLIEDKINILEKEEKKKGSPFFMDIKYSVKKLRNGLKFSDLQLFQNKKTF